MAYQPVEFGEYQVTFTSTTGSITVDTAQDTLAYVKVGRLVHVQGLVAVLSVSSPTLVCTMVGALPYAPSALTESADAIIFAAEGRNMGTEPDGLIRAVGSAGNTNLLLSQMDGLFLADDIQATTTIAVNFTYITD